MGVHTGGKSEKCTECNAGFSTKTRLSTHIKFVHSGNKYPCDKCGMELTTKGNLIAHQKRKICSTEFKIWLENQQNYPVSA